MVLTREQHNLVQDKFIVATSKKGGMYIVWAPVEGDKDREQVCTCRCERWANRIAQVLNGGANEFSLPPSPTGIVLVPGFIVTDHAVERWNLRVRRVDSPSLGEALAKGHFTKVREQDAIVNTEADAIFYLKKDHTRWVVMTVLRLSASFDQ